MKKEILVTLALLLCGGAEIYANDNQNREKADSVWRNLDVNPVVVTATGTPRRLKESPTPIAVITAEELKQGNILSLEDALVKLSPNITVMTNGMGTTVSLNGLEDDYFVFLENGKRMYGDGAYARIDISKVTRIEILSGAASVMYGTNAIGGVVNIVTEGSKSDENSVSGVMRTNISTHGRFKNSINADVRRGKLLSSTSFSRNESDGWQLSPYVGSGDDAEITNRPSSVGFKNNLFSQSFEYLLSEKLSFKVHGSYYDYVTTRPQTSSEAHSAYKYDMDHEDYTLGAGVVYKLENFNRLELDYYSDHYTSSYDYFDSEANGTLAGELVERKNTHYHNASLKSFHNFENGGLLASGLEYTHESLSSVSESIDWEDTYTTALFSQYEIGFCDHFTALAGLRYNYSEAFHSHLTYHASLRYNLKGLNVRAGYATGFKAPSLSDLYAPSTLSSGSLNLPNADLDPETSEYFSLNAEYSNKWLSLSVTIFQNDIKNLIVYETIATGDDADNYGDGGYTSVNKLINSSKAQVKGVNASINISPGYGLLIGAGYNYLDTEDYDTGMPTDRSVPHVFTCNASWVHDWSDYQLKVAVNGRISDKRYSSSYGYAPSYRLWDLTTSHAFKFDSIVLEPAVGVENVFDYVDDRAYNSNYATLSPGRSLFLSLTVKFN
ncbi:MAG: TonB-dependent receptor [Rikenellaceae bacterium]